MPFQPMTALYFPPFHLDLERAELRRGDQRISLRPKALALLEYLATRPDRVLGARELLHAVWPDVVVSGIGLKVCIRELRVALRDTARAPRFIETVPRRGYRFIAAVDAGAAGPGPGAPATGLFGRAAELAQLTQRFERARAGHRQMVWVTGEPGIGKTALVTAFLDQVRAGDASVWAAAGQCVEQYGSGEAFLPVLDALGRLAAGGGRRPLTAHLRQHAPSWLLQLPALLDDAEREALRRRQAGGTRERMLREWLGAVEAMGEARPLVLVLDDVHWSDVSTLELLAALARRQAPARVMVVATCRPLEHTAGGYPIGGLIGELTLRHQAVELPVAPLDVGAIGDYLLDRFGGSVALAALARPLHRHSEGNPLFMVSAVDHLLAHGHIGRARGSWVLLAGAAEVEQAIPDSLRQMVRAQLAHLRGTERRLLEAASVCGADVAADTVSAAVDGDVGRVDAGLAALARQRRFLRSAADGERPDGTVTARFAFAHGL
ncbi:MAG: ATP-binding protein, partial [Candidatus Binatia bacterium]